MSMHIGYVLKRFPRFSETFILNELLALERIGVTITIFSLLAPGDEARHGSLGELNARVIYLPKHNSVKSITIRDIEASKLSLNEEILSGPEFTNPIYSGKDREQVALLHVQATLVSLIAQQLSIDHLHAHFGSDATTVALLAARLASVNFSYTAHAKDIYHTYTTAIQDSEMRRAKIAEARFVATVTEYNYRHLVQLAPNAKEKIQVLYNGIDLSRFKLPLIPTKKSNTIVGVGRLIEKKGFSSLIDACAQLKQANVNFQCQIIGDGPLKDTLQNQINHHDLQGRVSLLAPQVQEDLIHTVGSATMMVLPCRVTESGDRDALPTVLLESLALGVPVITTAISGCPEIVGDNECGLLVPPDNTEALVSAITCLLNNPAQTALLGQSGRQRCERLFDLDTNVRVLHALFEQAVHQSAESII